MDSDEFRKQGHALVDWIAEYWRDLESRPVTPGVRPGDISGALPSAPPRLGEPFERIMEDFERVVLPGMSHWNHPGWMGYFPSSSSAPAVLGDMLTTSLAAVCMSWNTSPAATELEQVVVKWVRDLIALPADFTGVIQDTASSATLVAFLTARNRAGSKVADRLTAYWSEEAHSSVGKAARLAGFADHRCRVIPTDGDYAMDPELLAAVVDADREQDLVPGIIVGTMGTTASTGCDPLRSIGEVARQSGAWYHVDAAYGGMLAMLPEIRPLLDGVELADSMVTNPHKLLLTSNNCSTYFVRDVDALTRTFSTSPDYLRSAHDGEAVNFRDWGIPLGRRFNALRLWFVLRSHGVERLREMLRGHLKLAQELAGWVGAVPGWEVLAPVRMGLVCLRHVPANLAGDEAALTRHNAAILERVNATGKVFLSHAMLGERYAIRVAIGSMRTGREHVDLAWRLLSERRVGTN